MKRENDPLSDGATHATSNGRYRLSFVAELPSLGYRVYKRFSLPATDVKPEGLKANDFAMENNRFRLEFDPATGCISASTTRRSALSCLRVRRADRHEGRVGYMES